MEELNLENPIFILYIDVNGYSPMKAKEALEQLKNHFSYKNVTTWIIRCDVTVGSAERIP